MGQVHVAPALLDHIGGPVPPVGCFQYHLGVLAGLGQLGRQGDGVVVDADRLERLACLVAAHDHAASPVQVDADILLLLFHGSLLLSSPGWFRHPKCAPHTWSRATGGLPRALRLGLGLSGDFPRGHGIAPRARRAGPCAKRCPSHGSCAALLHYVKTLRSRRRFHAAWSMEATGRAQRGPIAVSLAPRVTGPSCGRGLRTAIHASTTRCRGCSTEHHGYRSSQGIGP